MLQNRCTQNIPINTSSIFNVMYPQDKVSVFLSPDEINQKTSTSNERDYSKRIPGVDYRSFGEKINL